MATRCTKCGAFLADGERFCPNCGENAPQVVAPMTTAPAPAPAPAPQYQQNTQYQQGAQYNQNTQYQQYGQTAAYAAPAYAAGYAAQPADEMTLGKWVGCLIVTNFLGIISLIFLFVWGFGSGPKSRQNYCRAMLIVKAIGIAASIILVPLFLGMLAPMLSEILDEIEYGYTGYTQMAAFISSFIH